MYSLHPSPNFYLSFSVLVLHNIVLNKGAVINGPRWSMGLKVRHESSLLVTDMAGVSVGYVRPAQKLVQDHEPDLKYW